jgi:hypothetical protein
LKIALSGKAGSGKSALAFCLERDAALAEMRSLRVGFADRLKSEVYAETQITKKDSGFRAAACSYGDLRYESNPDWLVDPVAVTLRDWWDTTPPKEWTVVIVDDLRRKGEASFLQHSGFTLVRLRAPLQARLDRLKADGHETSVVFSKHPAETDLDDYKHWHYYFNNDGGTLLPSFSSYLFAEVWAATKRGSGLSRPPSEVVTTPFR